jgi:hypothetical protein
VKRFAVALALAALFCVPAYAARVEQKRIDALLAAIEKSGCQFERNNKQYTAAEGATHLRNKLDRAGARIQTAAQFIEHIGTSSSQSGKPYRVLCPGQLAQVSRAWLEQRLAELIAAGQ